MSSDALFAPSWSPIPGPLNPQSHPIFSSLILQSVSQGLPRRYANQTLGRQLEQILIRAQWCLCVLGAQRKEQTQHHCNNEVSFKIRSDFVWLLDKPCQTSQVVLSHFLVSPFRYCNVNFMLGRRMPWQQLLAKLKSAVSAPGWKGLHLLAAKGGS